MSWLWARFETEKNDFDMLHFQAAGAPPPREVTRSASYDSSAVKVTAVLRISIRRRSLCNFSNWTYQFLKIGPIRTLIVNISRMKSRIDLRFAQKIFFFYSLSNNVSQRGDCHLKISSCPPWGAPQGGPKMCTPWKSQPLRTINNGPNRKHLSLFVQKLCTLFSYFVPTL